MKVQAEDLWPLILDFVESYFGEDELVAFKEHFHLKIEDHHDDPLVKAGGLKTLIASFLKHDKEAFKSFKKHMVKKNGKSSDVVGKKRRRSSIASDDSAPAVKKRQRTSSGVSASSATNGKKKSKKSKKAE